MKNNQTFRKGTTVDISENLQVIDRATVLNVETKKVRFQSLQAFPGEIFEFGEINEKNGRISWVLLFKGLADECCFSERAPTYSLAQASA